MEHPRVEAITAATESSTCMGMKQDLWKLIANPVALAKSSRIFLRVVADARSARQRMRVSSAYWRTGHGREVSTGWVRLLERKAARMRRWRTSATIMKRYGESASP